MNETVESLVLEHLRKLREGQDRMAEDIRDMKVRVTALEEGVAGIHRRMDRFEARLERIERRLELADA